MTQYDVSFTDPMRTPVTVMRKGVDGPGEKTTSTPLFLYGRGALEWGEQVDANMLRTLENYAGSTPPKYAVPGQLWSVMYMYWRNVTIPLSPDPNPENDDGFEYLRPGVFHVYDVEESRWMLLDEVVRINNIEDLSLISGRHAYDVSTDQLYLFGRPYGVEDIVPQLRMYVDSNRAPTADDPMAQEVLVMQPGGNWMTVGFRKANKSLSVDLDTLGSFDHDGIYFQDVDSDATTRYNYPLANVGGILIVRSAGTTYTHQVYVCHNGRQFTRHLISEWTTPANARWSDWTEWNHYDSILGKPVAYVPTPHSHNYYRDVTNRPNNTGQITMWPVESIPPHVIPCDGRSLDRVEYAELFAVIGTKYGSSDPSTFKVPDYTDMFLRHVKPGRTTGDVQQDLFKSHSHGHSISSNGSHTHSISVATAGEHTHVGTTGSAGSHQHGSGGTLSTASGGSHTHSLSNMYIPLRTMGGPWRQGGYDFNNQPDTLSRTVNIYVSGNMSSSGSHAHTVYVPPAGDHTHQVSVESSGSHQHAATNTTNGLHTHSVVINNSGGDETRPKNVAVIYAIVAYS